ncbi:MAG: hypothetical protein A2539_02645 [Elusimicrobia bacterium RIFOXYD2_FULL_34_15]|nr:MAG: hypothetical protein A2539_02645 [Elusimicrobia bacterium RIFOXYD2_FULL_34_15]
MAIPEGVKQQIENKLREYCSNRIPEHASDMVKLDFKIKGNSITLFEMRPAFDKTNEWVDIVIAQFRHNPENSFWTLYCADRNSKWNRYIDTDPTEDFDKLLKEVEKDPTGIFWG